VLTADQVETERRLADALGVRRWAAVVGGSMGGYRALEWAVATPDRVERLFLVATTAAASADQLGVQGAQVLAVTGDPGWHAATTTPATTGEGPHRGLGAGPTHGAPDLPQRRGARDALRSRTAGRRAAARGGRYAVQSYLDHHADKLAGASTPAATSR
jgi:homoserine O-acetyltransferase